MLFLILALVFIVVFIVLAVGFIAVLLDLGNWCEKKFPIWAKKYPKTWQTFWFIVIFSFGALMIWDKL
jgi:H+/Cl- antiporter ClcA